MNKHQIVENCRYLESIVQEQSDTIKNLENKVIGIQNVVYQLIGGLFCPISQAGHYQEHSNVLFRTQPSLQVKNIPFNVSKWGSNPTTRQGDSNESRIKLLESQMQSASKLLCLLSEEKIHPNVPREENEDSEYQNQYQNQYYNQDNQTTYSSSTHSSMPSLIENYNENSDSDSNSNYDFNSDESSLERRRISSELCCNE
jgi:hypothetical protein